MPQRLEFVNATETDVAIYAKGEQFGGEQMEKWTVVLDGGSGATFAIQGSPNEILDLLGAMKAQLVSRTGVR